MFLSKYFEINSRVTLVELVMPFESSKYLIFPVQDVLPEKISNLLEQQLLL